MQARQRLPGLPVDQVDASAEWKIDVQQRLTRGGTLPASMPATFTEVLYVVR